MRWLAAVAFGLFMCSASVAEETADRVRAHLEAGSFEEGRAELTPLAENGDPAAQFGIGVLNFFSGIEGFAQALYRHGFNPGRGIMVSPFMGAVRQPGDGGPAPEPLTYPMLRDYLGTLVADMDAARDALAMAGEGEQFAVDLDVLDIRIDFNSDGVASEDESVGAFLSTVAGMAAGLDLPDPQDLVPANRFAFDNADAMWLAGYSQILAVQADFILAHDFSQFFDAALHRFFPGAGLPMDGYQRGGQLVLDRDSDALIADAIAAIHTVNWPIEREGGLSGIGDRLVGIFNFSRSSWEMILAERDDHLEFIPSPNQTPQHPSMRITKAMVEAWLETLDVSEEIVNGELLLPHWRFPGKGFDLAAYLEDAERTDFVMLFTGLDALPFIKQGPVADAESFAAANAVFGSSIWGYAAWFN